MRKCLGLSISVLIIVSIIFAILYMCDDSISVIALLEYTESVEEEQPDKAQRTHTQKLVSLWLCVMAAHCFV